MIGRKLRSILIATLLGVAGFAVADTVVLPGEHTLLRSFEDDWEKQWREKKFGRHANRKRVVEDENGNRVLEFASDHSASGLWRELKIKPLTAGRLSWRWKIERSIDSALDERKKKGDDYAARVFVVFNRPLLPWRIRAICYVWASREPVDAHYRNPFSKNVQTIVLQSGDGKAGQWVTEERDIVADHIRVFGKSPKKALAFAVMVDTDNTGSSTTTWFDDMELRIDPPSTR